MNEIAKKSVSDRLISAIKKENLSVKETGAILGIIPAYVSMMKNVKCWKTCPAKAWDLALAWINSGYSLHDWRTRKPTSSLKHEETPMVHKEGIPEPPSDKFSALPFIKSIASKIFLPTGEEYYFIPFWFKQIKPGNSFEIITFDKLPKEVKEAIKTIRGE